MLEADLEKSIVTASDKEAKRPVKLRKADISAKNATKKNKFGRFGYISLQMR